jgi:uncharacterized MAPEG superfamily protein
MIFGDFSNFIATSITFNLTAVITYSFAKKDKWDSWTINRILLNFKTNKLDKCKANIDALRLLLNSSKDNADGSANCLKNGADNLEQLKRQQSDKYEKAKTKPINASFPEVCLFFIFHALLLLVIDGCNSQSSNSLAVIWSVMSILSFIVISCKRNPSYTFVINVSILSFLALFLFHWLNQLYLEKNMPIIQYDENEWFVELLCMVSYLGLTWYILKLMLKRYCLQILSFIFRQQFYHRYRTIMKTYRNLLNISEGIVKEVKLSKE